MLKNRADQGHAQAQYEVGLYLKYGLYWKSVNRPEAFEFLERVAQHHYRPAQLSF